MEDVVVRMKKHFKKEYTSKFDIDLDFGESYEFQCGTKRGGRGMGGVVSRR